MGLFKKTKQIEEAPTKRNKSFILEDNPTEEESEESEQAVDLNEMFQWQKEFEQFLKQELFDIKKRLARLESK